MDLRAEETKRANRYSLGSIGSQFEDCIWKMEEVFVSRTGLQSRIYKLLKLKSQDRAPNWGESAVNRIKIIQDKYTRDKGKKEKAGNLRPKPTIFVNTIWKQQKRKVLKIGGIILSLTMPPKNSEKLISQKISNWGQMPSIAMGWREEIMKRIMSLKEK